MASEQYPGYMSGNLCKLICMHTFTCLKDTFGPDPLRIDSDAEILWQALQRSARPVGLVLMDQKSISGLGNEGAFLWAPHSENVFVSWAQLTCISVH